MKPIQWIFHYIEINEMSSSESETLIDSLQDIELSLNLLLPVVNPESGKKAIDNILEFKKKRDTARNESKNNGSDEEDISKNSNYVELSDGDQELLEFMYEQPEIIEETNDMKNVGKFILPTVNRKDLEENGVKVIDKIEKKPKLGF